MKHLIATTAAAATLFAGTAAFAQGGYADGVDYFKSDAAPELTQLATKNTNASTRVQDAVERGYAIEVEATVFTGTDTDAQGGFQGR